MVAVLGDDEDGNVCAAVERGGGRPGAVADARALIWSGGDVEDLAGALEQASGITRAIMAEQGWHACQPRACKVTTIRDESAEPAIADHVRRDFTADACGVKLVGDITYIPTWEGWLYLATVIDCHSRAVIGWSMADHMRTSLVTDALTMAATHTDLSHGCVHHSDRGVQGGFNRSSQHLDHGGGNGTILGMGHDGDWEGGDAFSGAPAAAA